MRTLRLLPIILATLAAPACAQRASVDSSFAAVSAALSEPGGYFDTDNLISNEASYLHVIDGLRDQGVRGGAYVGVGPGQNFSYIAQIRPEIAIIVDIRRDNLLQQLLYKALFELAGSRAEYLAMLLSRPPPAGLAAGADIERIIAHFDTAAFSDGILAANRARLHQRIADFGFRLDTADLATIDRFHAAFGHAGLGLRFQSFGRAPQYYYPTLRDLMLERDRSGHRASYLATDEGYQAVRELQLRDRVIPAVGDLAGGRALPAIAAYLRDERLPLSAYYTSNVEFYLANEGTLDAFIENVRRLPRAPNAVIIRSVFRTQLPQTVSGYASTQLLQPVDSLLAAWDSGKIRSYFDLVRAGVPW